MMEARRASGASGRVLFHSGFPPHVRQMYSRLQGRKLYREHTAQTHVLSECNKRLCTFLVQYEK